MNGFRQISRFLTDNKSQDMCNISWLNSTLVKFLILEKFGTYQFFYLPYQGHGRRRSVSAVILTELSLEVADVTGRNLG